LWYFAKKIQEEDVMNLKKVIVMGLTLSMLASMAVGCGSTKSASPASTTAVKKDPVTVSIFVPPSYDKDEKFNKMLTDFSVKEPNIKVEKNVIPGEGGDMFQKIDVAVMSADTTDLIQFPNHIFENKYASNGLLVPLNDLAKQENVDLDKSYGKYMVKYNNTIYTIPDSSSIWSVYYNKKIFDDAKVPYPKGDWTWDQFIDTAKKLNNPAKGIYGSLFLQYDTMSYMLAQQRKVPAYKEDGTSNFDDPAFKESLKFYYDITNTFKIAPSWLEFKTKKLGPATFFEGKTGMEFVSSFMVDYVANLTQYPRDFKTGITKTPSAGPNGNTNLASVDFYGINKNSKNQKEAFKLLSYLGDNFYKVMNKLPARVDLSKEDTNSILKNLSDSTRGELSQDDLNNALLNNGMGINSEKITGDVATDFKANLLREAEIYYVDKKSLDDAVKDIKKTTDDAIKNKKAQK